MTKGDVLTAIFVVIVLLAIGAHILYPPKPSPAKVLKIDSITENGPGFPPPTTTPKGPTK